MVVLSALRREKYVKIMGLFSVITDMKVFARITLSVYFAFLIYSLLSFFLSPSGYIQYQKQLQYKARLEKNLVELQKINSSLSFQLNSLVSDKEKITLLSRELGYFEEGEGRIMINGYEKRKNFFTIGSILISGRSADDYGLIIRLSSILLGVLVFILFGFVKRKSHDLS